jgi:hypothetical protein
MTEIDFFEIASGVSAIVTQTDDINTFENTIITPRMLGDTRGWVPWGESDDLPGKIMEFVGKNEILSANIQFNISSIYGLGIKVQQKTPDGYQDTTDPRVLEFLDNNDLDNYLLEQITDLAYFYNPFPEIILNRAGNEILMINSKEATYSRWETMNPSTGKIENHLYSAEFMNFRAREDNTEVTPVLDKRNPLEDLRIRSASRKEKSHRYIIPINFPTPGKSYYQRPHWWSVFESGWYDIAMLIPAYKKALMTNQMTIKYHVQLHRNYFKNIFEQEGINDKAKQDERKKLELSNLKNFLSGVEKTGKTLISQIDYTHEGKETPMIKIEALENSFKGNEYLDDTDVAGNMLSYAMGVHPNLIGASPGKNGASLGGTDKRELFTIKQALVKPFRNIILKPLNLIKNFNKWPSDIEFVIPDIALTTLDKGVDKQTVIPE